MDEILIEQIKKATMEGWKLCAGCKLMFVDSPLCEFCPVEQRKLMGIPPERTRCPNCGTEFDTYGKDDCPSCRLGIGSQRWVELQSKPTLSPQKPWGPF